MASAGVPGVELPDGAPFSPGEPDASEAGDVEASEEVRGSESLMASVVVQNVGMWRSAVEPRVGSCQPRHALEACEKKVGPRAKDVNE